MKTNSKNKNTISLTGKIFILLMIVFSSKTLFAQSNSVAILNIETKGTSISPEHAGNLLSIELEKLGKFEVRDRYDVKSILEKNNITLNSCFGKECIINSGKILQVSKMIGGSIDKTDKRITIILRIYDVENARLEKTIVNEFLDIENEIKKMLEISLKNILDLSVDKDVENKLKNESSLDNSINNSSYKISAKGPRMGFTVVTGRTGKRMSEPTSVGGYDALPFMSQFGYQFETQYLNSGSFQALVEVIPMITGIDQGFFNPSITLLNGFRNNKNGWEFGIGATFSTSMVANGYYDQNNNWKLKNEWKNENPPINGIEQKNPNEIIKQIDSRGNLSFVSGFIIAAGKTFRSGRLNIPVNVYLVPDKSGFRYGANFGFNVSEK